MGPQYDKKSLISRTTDAITLSPVSATVLIMAAKSAPIY